MLRAPYSPTTTGEVERRHKTMRAEFFTSADQRCADQRFATMPELQATLDEWVSEYNTGRPRGDLVRG